jgi:peptide/nickel transport system substrate-binding protein
MAMFRFAGGAGGCRVWVALLAVATALAGTAACGSSSGGSSSKIRDLKLVIDEEPLSLNPGIQNTKAVLEVTEQVLQPLIAVDDSFQQVKTGLVSSWSEASPRHWVFQLRHGVTFSNAEAWNAQAAVFSIDTMKASTQGKPYLGSIAKATATGNYSFEITAANGSKNIPVLLSYIFAVPPKHYAQVGATAFGKKPVGTGPYLMTQWRPGSAITLAANSTYWGQKAHIGNVTVTWSSGDTGRQTPLQSHQVNLTMPLPITAISTIKSDPSLQVVSADSNRIAFVAFNTKSAPFNDPNLSRAATMAIDRKKLTTELLGGLVGPAPHLIREPAGIAGQGTSDYAALPYDPQQAKQLVAASHSHPSIRLSYGVGTDLRVADVASAMANMLRQVGFKVSTDPRDPSAYYSAMFASQLPNMFITSSGNLYPSPKFFADYTMASTGQLPQCRSTQYDPYIGAADTSTGLASYEHLRQAEKIATNDNACLEPLWDEPTVVGASASLHNIHIRLDQIIDLSQINAG